MQTTIAKAVAHQIFIRAAASVTSCHQPVTIFDDMRDKRFVLP
jgi:hypothetical protein